MVKGFNDHRHFHNLTSGRFKVKTRNKPLHNPDSRRHTQILPTAASRKAPKQAIIPFQGFKDIQFYNLADFYDFSEKFLRGNIVASYELSDIVTNIILNLFIQLPESSVEKGKRDYTRAERQYNREQLEDFLFNIPCLEVVHSNYQETANSTIGYFKNKNRYVFAKLEELTNSEAWKGDKVYHLVYLAEPANFVPGGDLDPVDFLSNIFPDYSGKIANIEKKIEECKEAQQWREEAEPDKLVEVAIPDIYNGTILEEYVGAFYALEKHLEENQKYPEFLAIIKELTAIFSKIPNEVSEQMQNTLDNIPNESGIVQNLIRNTAPKGLIIIKSWNKIEIPDAKQIAEYSQNLTLYQKS